MWISPRLNKRCLSYKHIGEDLKLLTLHHEAQELVKTENTEINEVDTITFWTLINYIAKVSCRQKLWAGMSIFSVLCAKLRLYPGTCVHQPSTLIIELNMQPEAGIRSGLWTCLWPLPQNGTLGYLGSLNFNLGFLRAQWGQCFFPVFIRLLWMRTLGASDELTFPGWVSTMQLARAPCFVSMADRPSAWFMGDTGEVQKPLMRKGVTQVLFRS